MRKLFDFPKPMLHLSHINMWRKGLWTDGGSQLFHTPITLSHQKRTQISDSAETIQRARRDVLVPTSSCARASPCCCVSCNLFRTTDHTLGPRSLILVRTNSCARASPCCCVPCYFKTTEHMLFRTTDHTLRRRRPGQLIIHSSLAMLLCTLPLQDDRTHARAS